LDPLSGKRGAAHLASGSDAQEREALLGILAHVAFAFADTPRGWVDRMPHHEVLNAVRSASEAYTGLEVSPPAVLERLAGQAGILVPAGKPADSRQEYEFLHHTFAEYLVARRLLELPGDDRMTIVAAHQWFDSDWAEVFPMLGGLLNESPRPDEARSLAAWFLDQNPDPLHYAFRTALRVLGETPGLEALLDSTRKRSLRIKTARLLTSGATRGMLSRTLAAASTLPGPVTEALLSLLNNQDRDVRQAAADMLARQEGAKATAALRSLSNDQDRSVREVEATGLARCESLEVTAALLTLLNDHDEDVRQAAAGVLAGQESPEVTATLLDDHHEDIRQAAAIMLARREGPEVTAALLTLLNDQDRAIRLTAARELARRDEVEILLQLGLLDTGSGRVQERFELAEIVANRMYYRVPPSDRER
jgi:copper(I)-binding protein